jgi:PilZ domain
MNNSDERRNARRQKFTYYMPVTNDETQELVGHLTDISDFGIRLDCPTKQPIEQEYHLRMALTSDVADKAFMIFAARSKWCLEDKLTPNTYNVGFQIMDLDPADVKIFNLMVAKYGAG